MKVAVYSLCRDRVDYTKACFTSLQTKAGIDFHHLIIDNGSTDATVEWLQNEYCKKYTNCVLVTSPVNVGISKASNIALDILCSANYDLICKCDNDCFIQSENILEQISEIYENLKQFHPKFVLSPKVEGIVNQPTRGAYTMLSRRRIGLTAIVGGLFHCVPTDVYRQYRYPEHLPLAHGQDDDFCNWVIKNGGQIGYIEGLVVEHYEGTHNQALRYPEYFKRKHEEEKTISV
jgi:GT2 family glycosyltransferase